MSLAPKKRFVMPVGSMFTTPKRSAFLLECECARTGSKMLFKRNAAPWPDNPTKPGSIFCSRTFLEKWDGQTKLAPRAPLVCDDTTILCLQNGLGSEQIARAALGGRGIVLRGITQFGAIFKSPGVIQYMAGGYTLVERHQRSARAAGVLTAAGLDCRVSPN